MSVVTREDFHSKCKCWQYQHLEDCSLKHHYKKQEIWTGYIQSCFNGMVLCQDNFLSFDIFYVEKYHQVQRKFLFTKESFVAVYLMT